MLRLESLELVGFKSFADKVRINFDGGVTSVIGPNGCGKSNLFDAIGWVLGGQSPRYLRGDRMEDLIFNGSGKRRPSGLAKVALTLRKNGRPVVVQGREIHDDTIEICRKLYRSGESVYAINQRRCRLKDIHQVMEDLGLGFSSYALIAQGKIDSMLTSKPLERRIFLEEAAGIVGYKNRRRRAELKLEMAQANLERVGDVIGEVERRLRSLKRQAAKARRYRRIKDEFRRVVAQKFALDALHHSRRLDATCRLLEKCREQEAECVQQLKTRQSEYRNQVQERDRLEALLSQQRGAQSELAIRIERTANSSQYHEEQSEATRNRLRANREEQKQIDLSITRLSTELTRLDEELQGVTREEERVRGLVEKQTGLLAQTSEEITGSEQAIEELRDRLLRLSAETAGLGNRKEQLQQRIRETQAGRTRLEKDRADRKIRQKEAVSALKQLDGQIDARQLELEQLQARRNDSLTQRQQWEARLQEFRDHEAELNNQLIASRERLQSLQEVELSRSQYSEGVRKLLNHLHKNQSIRAGGTLADNIETRPEYERLVEEFLDKELEYVLVDSMDEAVLGLSEIKTLQSGKCTFLSIHSSNGFGKQLGSGGGSLPSGQPGVHGSLIGLLQMKPEVEEAFRRVLPQRAEAIVVGNLDNAFELAHQYPEQTFITLEGEALTPRGLLSSAASGRKFGLLSLKRQKRRLESKAAEAAKKLAQVQEELELRRLQLASLDEELETGRREIHAVEKSLLRLHHDREQAQAEAKRQEQGLKVVEDEIARLNKEQTERNTRLQAVRREQREKEGERLEVERLMQQTGSVLQKLKREFDRLQGDTHQVASDCKVLEERRLSLQRTLERVREQQAAARDRAESARRSEQDNETRLEQLKTGLEELGKEMRELRRQEKALEDELKQTQAAYQTWKKNFPRIEAELEELSARRETHQQRRTELEIEQARHETQLEAVRAQCVEQLDATPEEVLPSAELEDLDRSEIEGLHQQLKDRLENFGPINMTALDEYQENEERHQFLVTQRQDTEQSISDAEKAILDLNRRSRHKFRDAFETVNQYFQQVFEKLFGGGECGMRLLDEDDILESGLEIYAQPPGKKLQNVMLLSGGEKALTVLALLVALFTYRPSKFCVLDEVDAPLDDANVARFNNLIREMSQEIQLILITHNKQTMQRADTLYGVTMGEPGISQVVSVRM